MDRGAKIIMIDKRNPSVDNPQFDNALNSVSDIFIATHEMYIFFTPPVKLKPYLTKTFEFYFYYMQSF